MLNKNSTNNVITITSENLDWKVIQKDMRSKLGNDIYESWLKKIDFVEELNNYVLLSGFFSTILNTILVSSFL